MWRDTLHDLEKRAAERLLSPDSPALLLRAWQWYAEYMRRETIARYRRTARRMLEQGPRVFNAWRALEGYPLLWLANEDFSRLFLEHTNWKNCVLAQASFQHAKLSNAKFEGAVLHRTDFRYATLMHVTMEGHDWNDVVGVDASYWSQQNRWFAPPPPVRMRRLSEVQKWGRRRSLHVHFANNTDHPVAIHCDLKQGPVTIGEADIELPAGAAAELWVVGKRVNDSSRYELSYTATHDEAVVAKNSLFVRGSA